MLQFSVGLFVGSLTLRYCLHDVEQKDPKCRIEGELNLLGLAVVVEPHMHLPGPWPWRNASGPSLGGHAGVARSLDRGSLVSGRGPFLGTLVGIY